MDGCGPAWDDAVELGYGGINGRIIDGAAIMGGRRGSAWEMANSVGGRVGHDILNAWQRFRMRDVGTECALTPS